MFPLASVAVQVTTVAPTLNTAGALFVTVTTAVQLSIAVGELRLTIAPQFGPTLTAIVAGVDVN